MGTDIKVLKYFVMLKPLILRTMRLPRLLARDKCYKTADFSRRILFHISLYTLLCECADFAESEIDTFWAGARRGRGDKSGVIVVREK